MMARGFYGKTDETDFADLNGFLVKTWFSGSANSAEKSAKICGKNPFPSV
jgi:hypothetical protein